MSPPPPPPCPFITSCCLHAASLAAQHLKFPNESLFIRTVWLRTVLPLLQCRNKTKLACSQFDRLCLGERGLQTFSLILFWHQSVQVNSCVPAGDLGSRSDEDWACEWWGEHMLPVSCGRGRGPRGTHTHRHMCIPHD